MSILDVFIILVLILEVYLRVSTQLYSQRRSKSKISFKCTLENYPCIYNPFEWHLKTDGSTGIHVMLMAFSHFLNDVIITYGNTEAISHLLNTNMLPPVLRFLTVTFRTSPVFRTVFSPEVKVVFFCFSLGCAKEGLIRKSWAGTSLETENNNDQYGALGLNPVLRVPQLL